MFHLKFRKMSEIPTTSSCASLGAKSASVSFAGHQFCTLLLFSVLGLGFEASRDETTSMGDTVGHGHVGSTGLDPAFLTSLRTRAGLRSAILDLGDHNRIYFIDARAFDAVPQLRCLRLAGNNIRVIYEDTFVGVPHLRVSEQDAIRSANVRLCATRN